MVPKAPAVEACVPSVASDDAAADACEAPSGVPEALAVVADEPAVAATLAPRVDAGRARPLERAEREEGPLQSA